MTLRDIERIIMGLPPRTISDRAPEEEETASDSDTGEGDGSGSDGAPDQPEKYLHCRYSGYIAQVEAPEPREKQDDEGYTFC